MVKAIGTGKYLPEKVLTNDDLEKMVDTNDEWIVKRTGIKERHIADSTEATSDLAHKASIKALEAADMSPEDVELIIVGTSTADYSIPACAPIVQAKLGCKKIPAFDINSVCTSFSYSFLTAYSLLASGFYDNCLLIGADMYSRILNWKDRGTCVIFADGAGAVVLKRDLTKKGMLSYIYGADGKDANLIKIPVGGSKFPGHFIENNYKTEDLYFQMEGKKVYEFTINIIPEIIDTLLKKASFKINDIDRIILHQANIRIIEMVSKKLDIPIDRFVINIDKYGNTSSASIPIALDEAVRDGRIKEGNKIMSIGFGGGLSWGGFIFEW